MAMITTRGVTPPPAEGIVARVSGPVVEVTNLGAASVFDLVELGPLRLPGEVTAIHGDVAVVQVYDYAGGLRPGDAAVSRLRPLSARLGPGLLGGVFDGVLNPLLGAGDLLQPGLREFASERRWEFKPLTLPGTLLEGGGLLGEVPETAAFNHRVMVPPGLAGELEWVAPAGGYDFDDVIARVGGSDVHLVNSWPVRHPRPVARRLHDGVPLVTGQRIIDIFYPLAKGSAAGVPGGFGTGKTVLLQQIAKWCDADVIVYVGCGERGNEMADVLTEFAELKDPRTGRLLMERTVVIANTSNMPVMAREASIHSGMTVAEYFRDMGLDVVTIADSTSRWAEAMREFASRTGQLPAEEGYPAGLASAMAAFYERAGRVVTLSGQEASVTLIASVSPPGGDMTEPVTAHTNRFVRGLWALDRDLAYARHYPAVSWRESYSRDAEALGVWYAEHQDPGWASRRGRALALLAEADRLESVAQLIGVTSLPDRERVVMLMARLLREAVMEQSAIHPNDNYCVPAKQAALLEMVLAVYDRCLELVDAGVAAAIVEEHDFSSIGRAGQESPPEDADSPAATQRRVLAELEGLK